jgi:hypothetical protein
MSLALSSAIHAFVVHARIQSAGNLRSGTDWLNKIRRVAVTNDVSQWL